jgi:hypothetical protein
VSKKARPTLWTKAFGLGGPGIPLALEVFDVTSDAHRVFWKSHNGHVRAARRLLTIAAMAVRTERRLAIGLETNGAALAPAGHFITHSDFLRLVTHGLYFRVSQPYNLQTMAVIAIWNETLVLLYRLL